MGEWDFFLKSSAITIGISYSAAYAIAGYMGEQPQRQEEIAENAALVGLLWNCCMNFFTNPLLNQSKNDSK